MSLSKNESNIGNNSERINKNDSSNQNLNLNDKNKENISVLENSIKILKKKRKRKDEKFPFNNDINKNKKISISLKEKHNRENNSSDISEKIDESDSSVESGVSKNKMNNINNINNISSINEKSLINKDNNNIVNINDIKDDENYKEITKIINKSICIINCDEGKIRNGFFCNIPAHLGYQNQNNSLRYFPTLIINDYSLKENDLSKGKISNITLNINANNLYYSITIDKSRKVYSYSNTHNITIIEIEQTDGIDNTLFLDIDKFICNENYEKLSYNKKIF